MPLTPEQLEADLVRAYDVEYDRWDSAACSGGVGGVSTRGMCVCVCVWWTGDDVGVGNARLDDSFVISQFVPTPTPLLLFAIRLMLH